MRAFIFVYTDTKFEVDMAFEVKQFEPSSERAWDESDQVAPGGTFARGIYGILSDRTISDSSIVAVDGNPTQHDILILRDKDGWPDPKIAAWVRMKAEFPEVVDRELQVFLAGKGV